MAKTPPRRRRRQRRSRNFDHANFRRGEVLRVLALKGFSKDEANATYAALAAAIPTWNAQALGAALELTIAQRVKWNIKSIDCCDLSKVEQEAFYRERNRFKDRDRKRREAKERQLGARAAAMLALVQQRGPMCLSAIGAELSTHPAFVSRDGEILSAAGMRKAMSVGSQKLERERLVTRERIPLVGGAVQSILRPVTLDFPVTLGASNVTGDKKPPHTEEVPMNG